LTRVYLDANVFVYAVGGESARRRPCREILRAVAERRLSGETSAYSMQELVRQRQRRGDAEATARARAAARLCESLHPVDRRVALDALDVVDHHPGLDIADAVHVATAIGRGIAVMISADRDLDAVTGIERVDPLDSARLAVLISE
jgi:hypothetical protein